MLTLEEYAHADAIELARLVAKKQVTPKELAALAAQAIAVANPSINCVVESYADRIAGLDEKTLSKGAFHGVPFLIKDVFGHEKGRKIEFGSRLCEGMICDWETAYATQLKAAGINIIGRTSAPEYSMSATTETLFYGNTSNPWKQGFSAGGSSGGAAAAVASGMVPIAHGSDIGGSIRIPASWCGGVGLKPSRGRISIAPVVDESGLGFSSNFVQSRSVRDSAALLDVLSQPQVGDPFLIPKPAESYAELAKRAPKRMRIGMMLTPLFGVAVDGQVAAAVRATAKALESAGHDIVEIEGDIGGLETLKALNGLFFFGFDQRLDGFGKKTGRKPGPDTLEPVMYDVYKWAKTLSPATFFASQAAINIARRKMAQAFTRCDVLLTPTTARVSEAWGKYHLARKGADAISMIETLYAEPIQFTVPHNIMGTPAISLPLVMHSTGVSIGVQLAAKPAEEHVLLQFATLLEQAMPWAGRIPALHVTKLSKAKA